MSNPEEPAEPFSGHNRKSCASLPSQQAREQSGRGKILLGGYGRLGPVGTFWLLTKRQGREKQPQSRYGVWKLTQVRSSSSRMLK
jgi:hypothetical protein